MSGNFSGGSFSGAVGGFSVDGGSTPTVVVAPTLGGSKQRYFDPSIERLKGRKKDDEIFYHPEREGQTDVPFNPATALGELVEDHSADIAQLRVELAQVREIIAATTDRIRVQSLNMHVALLQHQIREYEDDHEVIRMVADLDDEF